MHFSKWTINRTGEQTMLYPTCSTISSEDIARYGVSRAKNLGISEMSYKKFINFDDGCYSLYGEENLPSETDRAWFVRL